MAAAQGTVRFTGASGRVYAINMYLSDASGVLAKFDNSKVAVAGSPDAWTTPENGAVTDVALTTDVATPTALQVMVDGQPTGDILDCTAQLVSVVVRPNPRIPIAAGHKLSIAQIA